jgi:major membrane immunogen (membrane-anchored lipoprotein)
MLNKISAIFLVFVLCTSLLLTGCSQSEAEHRPRPEQICSAKRNCDSADRSDRRRPRRIQSEIFNLCPGG